MPSAFLTEFCICSVHSLVTIAKGVSHEPEEAPKEPQGEKGLGSIVSNLYRQKRIGEYAYDKLTVHADLKSRRGWK